MNKSARWLAALLLVATSLQTSAATPFIQFEPGPLWQFHASQPDASFAVAIRLSSPMNETVTVRLRTTPGSAIPGADYTPPPESVTFAAGETNQSVVVPILDDYLAEAPETLTLTLSEPTVGVVLGTNWQAVVTIYDNERGGPEAPRSISFTGTVGDDGRLDDAVTDEGDAAQVTLFRSGDSSEPVSIRIRAVLGEAEAGKAALPRDPNSLT